MDSAGDPVVAFGPHNTVYYGNIVFSRGAPTGDGTEAANGIALNVSHDGGLHWDEPIADPGRRGRPGRDADTPAHIFNDKIWLGRRQVAAGGSTSPGPGSRTPPTAATSSRRSCVAASTDYGRTFATATDGWTPRWTSSNPAASRRTRQGSNPQVGRDGTLYIAYEGEDVRNAGLRPVRHDRPRRDRGGDDHATTAGRSHTAIVDTNYDFPFNEPLGTVDADRRELPDQQLPAAGLRRPQEPTRP